MSAGRALFRFLYPITLDRFHPKTNRSPRVSLRLYQCLFHRLVHFFQILPFLDGTNVPPQFRQSRKCGFHRKTVFRNSSGKFGVVVRNNQNKRVDLIPARQSWNRRHCLFGLALHAASVRNYAECYTIPFCQFVTQSQSLCDRNSRAQRSVANEDAFWVEVAFSVPSQLAFNGAKLFQIIKRHSIEPILRA